MKSTGNRIQARRLELGLSRATLAKRLKTTRMTVWRIENGKTQVPSDELPRFARALKLQVSELVA